MPFQDEVCDKARTRETRALLGRFFVVGGSLVGAVSTTPGRETGHRGTERHRTGTGTGKAIEI